MTKNYIIVHGSFGSKDGNWFPWLKGQLENNNQAVQFRKCQLELVTKILKIGRIYLIN